MELYDKKQLRAWVAEGKLETCIGALLKLSEQLPQKSISGAIVKISARYKKYESDQNSGTRGPATLSREFNRLTAALLNLIEGMPLREGSPSYLYDLPLPRNNHFQGRAADLAEINNHFTRNWVVVLTGIGSIGKTQLANEFAHRAKAEKTYEYIFWLSADTAADHLSPGESESLHPESLLQSAARIAQTLDLEEKDVSTKDTILKSLFNWLKTHNNWLLVIDNVRQWKTIDDFIPLKECGHILITTQRVENTGLHIRRIDVGKMDKEDGRQLLLSRSHHRLQELPPAEQSAVEKIAEAIDGLPLALIHAAFYIDTRKCSFEEFLELYINNPIPILKIPGGTIPGEYEETILTTWSMALDSIRQSHAEAIQLLEFFAFCHPDGLHERVLEKGGYLMGPAFDASAANRFFFLETFRYIADFSLVQKDTSDRFIMHRLVQLIIRSNLPANAYHSWQKRLLYFYSQLFPDPVHNNADWCEALIPHVLEFAQHFDARSHETPNTAFSLLFARAIKYLASRAQFEKALQLYAFAKRQIEDHYGKDTPELLPVYNEVISVLVTLGGNREAAVLLNIAAGLLQEKPSSIGLEMQINQGLVYKSEGNFVQAEAMLEDAAKQALALKNLPLHAVAANRLGMLYFAQAQNVPDEAEALRQKAETCYKNARRVRHKLFPPNSAQMAELHNNLALLQSQANPAEARRLFERAFEIYKKAYGAEHPDFGFCCYNYGLLHFHLGELSDSKRYLLEALGIWERLNIPESVPSAQQERNLVVIKILDSLLAILLNDPENKQQLNEAIVYCERILAIYQRDFQEETLSLLNYLNILGHLQRLAQRWVEGDKTYEEAGILLEEFTAAPKLMAARIYNNHGVLCLEMQDRKRALRYFSLAMDAWEQDPAGQAENQEEFRNFLANAFSFFHEDPHYRSISERIYSQLALLNQEIEKDGE
ncbi:MAG: tetratricopeptide repeat protein [Saprospiraceae bacterium]|nr:tetratricopeptide repeat protein [Saprospiraceae bacterium]